MSPGFRVWQTKPGKPVEITRDLKEGQVWTDSTRKASLQRQGSQLTAAFYESGVVLIATANWYRNEYYINFQIRIPKLDFTGKTRGFLGNLDGNPTNDFTRRASPAMPLADTISEAALLDHLKTCKYYLC